VISSFVPCVFVVKNSLGDLLHSLWALPASTLVELRQKAQIPRAFTPELVQLLTCKSPLPVAARLSWHVQSRFGP
jgi:hypothetical protein